jgi:hypothetical protein
LERQDGAGLEVCFNFSSDRCRVSDHSGIPWTCIQGPSGTAVLWFADNAYSSPCRQHREALWNSFESMLPILSLVSCASVKTIKLYPSDLSLKALWLGELCRRF